MSEISPKKKKFKRLSPEELARSTGLAPATIHSLIDEYTAERQRKDKPAERDHQAGFSLSASTILLTALLFAALTFTIYFPSLHGQFVFDDAVIENEPMLHITRLPQLFDLLTSRKIERAVGMMSFALNYYFGGLHPFGYHLVNVIIHMVNGLILFVLSYRLFTLSGAKERVSGYAFEAAFLGSVLWLVHPLQSQAVAYIVQRLTSLSSLFYLLSLLWYVEGRVRGSYRVVWFTGSVLWGLLALGTKQNTATLPFFIMVTELLFFGRHSLSVERRKVGFFILLGGVCIIIAGTYLGFDFISRIALQYQERGWTVGERVLTELRVVVMYISLLLYPHPSRLNLDHDISVSHSLFSPFSTFGSFLFIAGLLSLAIFLVRRNRFIAYALFWFFGNLVIESSVIPLELVFEHRMYLPSMGIFMLVAGVGVGVGSGVWRRGVIGVMMVVTVLCSYWTYERAFVWRGPFSLWMDAVQKSPHKARPHNNLGNAYEKKGVLNKAITECKKALAIDPNYRDAHNNLGLAYNEKGMVNEAITECKKALAIDPNFREAYYNLGTVYAHKGQTDEAIAAYKRAIAINPNDAKTHYNLGNAYATKGQTDEAIAAYKRAIAINPNYAMANNNLGSSYASKGQTEEAIAAYKRALAIDPNNATAHYNLGTAYAHKGQTEEAIAEYKRAIAINPNYAMANNNLGSSYDSKGQTEEAIAAYKRAIAINPNFPEVYYNLGNAYAHKGETEEAITAYKRALAIDPNRAKTHYNLGLVYNEKGMVDEAKSEYKTALANNPHLAESLISLGVAYHKKGEFDKAISKYKRVLAINNDYAMAHNNLALSYYSKGNHKLAIKHCDRAMELGYSVNPKLLELLTPYR